MPQLAIVTELQNESCATSGAHPMSALHIALEVCESKHLLTPTMQVMWLIENRCLVTWSNLAILRAYGDPRSKSSVALSTCESEYFAMILASKEIIWLTRVLTEAGLEPNSEVPLCSDNQAAIGWATAETMSIRAS